jgi:hypothetical protein
MASTSSSSYGSHDYVSPTFMNGAYRGLIVSQKPFPLSEIAKIENGMVTLVFCKKKPDTSTRTINTPLQTIAPPLDVDDYVLAYDPDDFYSRHFFARIIDIDDRDISVNLFARDGSEFPYYYPKNHPSLTFMERFIPVRMNPKILLPELPHTKALKELDVEEDDEEETLQVEFDAYHLTRKSRNFLIPK